jgi:hypothetical protein
LVDNAAVPPRLRGLEGWPLLPDRRHAELAQYLRRDQDVLDFGMDRLGEQPSTHPTSPRSRAPTTLVTLP